MAAALLVICIHTAPLASFSEPWDFALKTLARLAVPFFFAATGFFLFGGRIAPGPRPAGLSPAVRRFCAKTGALYAVATLLYLPVSVYGGKLKGITFGACVRDVVLDGTFYHLWYLPAAILGVLLLDRLLRLPGRMAWPAGAASAALYLVGLLGDSWYGGGQALPALQPLYRALFLHMDYTRCGLFFAPVFLWLGAVLRDLPRPRLRTAAVGFAVSAALLFGEAFGLRALGWPRHDSMYLALLPCTYFLFACLLAARGPSLPFWRECSMLVYVLHPMMIVLVRGAAKVLHMQKWLVENSLIHFLAVSALSVAVSAAAAAVMPPVRKTLRRWPHGKPLGERRGASEIAGSASEPAHSAPEAARSASEITRSAPAAPAAARAWAVVDLDAIAHNARALQGCLPRGCRLMAVVKADAYGHGAPAVAGRLWRMGVRAFAVATLEEGAELRRCGITGEILILGYTNPARVPELLRWRLSQTVADAAHAKALSEVACKKAGCKRAAGRKARAKLLPVHIAVDTGMHRLGIPARDIQQVAQLLGVPKTPGQPKTSKQPETPKLPETSKQPKTSKLPETPDQPKLPGSPALPDQPKLPGLPGLEVRGLFTHLAVADSLAPEDEAFTRAQLAAFAALTRNLRGMGCTLPPLHALASGGILNYGQLPLHYARAGIALYGASSGALHNKAGAPGCAAHAAPALKPALSLYARVVSVRTVPEGACAGYGRAFCAARPTLLAVVSIGYADGVPRALGEGRGTALLRGTRVPIVGRICMDQLFVDATETGAAVGDIVTLIGKDGGACVTAEETAEAAGTIANELLCRIGRRTARVYSME
ncbi:MAG: amino-acid racemase [Subdoligranulum sp.]|nr:amino-acid racemase [Subdoligranulum sp.]